MSARSMSERRLRGFLERERRRRSRISVPPVGQLLTQTLDLAQRMVPCRAGSLLLDDPRAKRHAPAESPLTFVAAFGPRADELLGQTVPSGQGLVGAVYESGEPLTCADPRSDPRFFAAIDEAGVRFRTRSLLAVPVRLETHVCGVLELVNRRGRADFSGSDQELAVMIAGHMSRIVLNAVDVLKQNALARTDDLTGLRNARGLTAEIGERVRRSRRRAREVCVLFLDVDGLKAVNDAEGHRAGSEAIRRVGQALASAAEPGESVHRFGGDEFVVVAEGGMSEGRALGERLRGSVAAHTEGALRHGGRVPELSVSVGVASTERLAGDEREADVGSRLLAAADRALYRAKRQGRDRCVAATARDDHLGRRKR